MNIQIQEIYYIILDHHKLNTRYIYSLKYILIMLKNLMQLYLDLRIT